MMPLEDSRCLHPYSSPEPPLHFNFLQSLCLSAMTLFPCSYFGQPLRCRLVVKDDGGKTRSIDWEICNGQIQGL